MVKLSILLCMAVLTVTACNQDSTEKTTSTDSSSWKENYDNNLNTLQSVYNKFENEDIDGLSTMIADNVDWQSPAYGDSVHTKQHWMESLRYYVDNWDNIHYTNPIFLPGVDTTSKDFDGSVRTYGTWVATHKSGVTTRVNYYGTFDFNDQHKIVSASEYFDVGGLMQAVSKGN